MGVGFLKRTSLTATKTFFTIISILGQYRNPWSQTGKCGVVYTVTLADSEKQKEWKLILQKAELHHSLQAKAFLFCKRNALSIQTIPLLWDSSEIKRKEDCHHTKQAFQTWQEFSFPWKKKTSCIKNSQTSKKNLPVIHQLWCPATTYTWSGISGEGLLRVWRERPASVTPIQRNAIIQIQNDWSPAGELNPESPTGIQRSGAGWKKSGVFL